MPLDAENSDVMPRARTRTLPPALHAVNESLAFLIELVMLGGLAWWGATVHGAIATRVVLALAAPLAAAVVWAMFAAPRARIRLPVLGVLGVKAVVFGLTALAVAAAGLPAVAIVVGVIALVSASVAAVDREAAGGGGRTPPGA